MFRARSVVAALLVTSALVGCGGGGGLFATVPPPVEFVGSLVPGVEAVPSAGVYSGTVTKERVTYVYSPGVDGAEGSWAVESAEPLADPVAAQATVAEDGTVALKETAGTRNLFVGNLEVLEKASIYGSTVANLMGTDGAKGTYPYLLLNTTHPTLELMPRANLRQLSNTRVRYDRYSFVLIKD